MRKCAQCGLENDELICPICGRPMIAWKPSIHGVRRLALAIVIPLLVWLAMTSLFGW